MLAKFAKRVEGRTVLAIDRRAKYLLLRLDDGNTLIAHLGMSGRMTLHDARSAAEHPFERHRPCRVRDSGLCRSVSTTTPVRLDAVGGRRGCPRHVVQGLVPSRSTISSTALWFSPLLSSQGTQELISPPCSIEDLVGVHTYAVRGSLLAGISPRRSCGPVQGAQTGWCHHQAVLLLDRRRRLDLARVLAGWW